MPPGPVEPLRTLRWYLLALFVFSLVGMAAELILAKHYDSFWKAVPLGLFGLALVTLVPCILAPRRPLVVTFQGVMLLFILSGAVGVYRHYQGKAEFALERNRTLSGAALLREVIFKGINPPLLAPGAMVALGLLGLACTYSAASFSRTGGKR